jgi:ABC-type sugar transport system substrate-binding protein
MELSCGAGWPEPRSVGHETGVSGVPAIPKSKMSGRIALFLADGGEYQELLWDNCQEAAQRHGFAVRAFWADGDSQKQLRQIQGCVNEPEDQRPTIIIVSPVREIALISTAHAAASVGIGWVLLHRWANYMTHLRREFSNLPIFSVMADQDDIGRIQGRQVKALLPHGGKIVYIRGPLGTWSAIRRFAGLQEVLQGTAIELSSVNSDWTTEGGARAMRDWLRASPLVTVSRFVVTAQNDAMAMGARNVIGEVAGGRPGFDVEGFRVCGCDGSPNYGQRLVTEGKLTSTVIVPHSAGRAVSEVASMMTSGSRPPAQIVLAPKSFPPLHVLQTLAA